jgi:uncharacterized protein
MSLVFEWDAEKASVNRIKHRVSFEEASTVLGDLLSVTIADPLHWDASEQRFVTIGTSRHNRILVVVHCNRGERIRIISARKATRRERHAYEEEK